MKKSVSCIAGGCVLIIVGIPFYLALFPALLKGAPVIGTSLFAQYFIASFGALASGWGILLLRASGDLALQKTVAIPAALTFFLLAAMRLATFETRAKVLDIFPSPLLSGAVLGGEILGAVILAIGFISLLRR